MLNKKGLLFRIKRQSGVDFPDMLYFDDEKEHLSEVAGTCTGKLFKD